MCKVQFEIVGGPVATIAVRILDKAYQDDPIAYPRVFFRKKPAKDREKHVVCVADGCSYYPPVNGVHTCKYCGSEALVFSGYAQSCLNKPTGEEQKNSNTNVQKVYKNKANGGTLGAFREGEGAILLRAPTVVGNLKMRKGISEDTALHWICTAWGINEADIVVVEEEVR
jgi:hypothetical protein